MVFENRQHVGDQGKQVCRGNILQDRPQDLLLALDPAKVAIGPPTIPRIQQRTLAVQSQGAGFERGPAAREGFRILDRDAPNRVHQLLDPGEIDQSVMVDRDLQELLDDLLLVRNPTDGEGMIDFREAVARQLDTAVPRNRQHPAATGLGIQVQHRQGIRPDTDIDRLPRSRVHAHQQDIHRLRRARVLDARGERRAAGHIHDRVGDTIAPAGCGTAVRVGTNRLLGGFRVDYDPLIATQPVARNHRLRCAYLVDRRHAGIDPPTDGQRSRRCEEHQQQRNQEEAAHVPGARSTVAPCGGARC